METHKMKELDKKVKVFSKEWAEYYNLNEDDIRQLKEIDGSPFTWHYIVLIYIGYKGKVQSRGFNPNAFKQYFEIVSDYILHSWPFDNS